MFLLKLAQLVVGPVIVAGSRQQTYRAAVVEFAPTMVADLHALDVDQANDLKLANLAGLEMFAKEAKRNGSQIVVFPEYGITGDGSPNENFKRATVPPLLEELPDNVTNPCSESDLLSAAPAIAQASCIAKELEMVVVINLLTRKSCDAGINGCPEDGMRVHNTAVAFSEEGAILAWYDKRHPYGDETHFVDAGDESMKGGVTFTTSFGVKFGMFICFDILFYTDGGPDALEIVYPTDWVNNVLGPIPEPVSARNAQRTWSRIHRKNLIAANYGGFAKGSSGSGIWHAGEELVSYFNPTKEPVSKLLIADVPIQGQAKFV